MRVMLLGASGLVGQGVLQALREAGDVQAIVLVGRHRLDAEDARIEQHVLPDLMQLHAGHPALQGVDACIDCIGVLPGVSEATFREVTVDLNLHVARAFAQASPHGVFAYVSGAGSDPDSALMPLRVKGIAEREIGALPIAVRFLRPGIVQPVDGVHSPHAARNAAYAVGGPLMGLARRLAPSAFTTTRAIGRTMLAAVRDRTPGRRVFENEEIERHG